MTTLIITKKDDFTSHSCEFTTSEMDVVIPTNDGTYQYFINVDSEIIENIICAKIFFELFSSDIKGYTIKIDKNLIITNNTKKIIKKISAYNKIVYFNPDDKLTIKQKINKYVSKYNDGDSLLFSIAYKLTK